MEISVDGIRRSPARLPETMGQLIAEVKSDLRSRGRVLLAMSIDGHRIDADQERDVLKMPLEGFSELVIETAEPKTLCLATLEEVANHVQPIADESKRISELIDTGKDAQALARIVSCIEVWSAIINAASNIAQLMEVDMDQVSTEDESLPDCIHALVEMLETLKAAMGSRDLVTVRDVMKHQMPEVSDRIAAQLAALSGLVASK